MQEEMVTQLKNLFLEAFYTDSTAYVEHFFNTQIEKEGLKNAVTITENDQIVSAGYIIKKPAFLHERHQSVYYLTALATKQEFRKKGYFSKLMQKMVTELYNKKIPYCFLYPFDHKFYLKYGFNNVSFCKQVELNGNKDDCIETEYKANTEIPKKIINQLVELEKAELSFWQGERMCSFLNCLTFGEKEIRERIKEFSIDGKSLFTYSHKGHPGYGINKKLTDYLFAYCFKGSDKIYYYCANVFEKERLFNLKSLRYLKAFDFQAEKNTVPYIQARVTNVLEALKTAPFYTLDLFKKRSLRNEKIVIKVVLDDLVKENNGIYEIIPTQGYGFKAYNNEVKKIEVHKAHSISPDYTFNIKTLTKILLRGSDITHAQTNHFVEQY